MRCDKKIPRLAVPLLLLFVSRCAIEQLRFEVTLTSTHRGLVQGERKEALAYYEAPDVEAERNAVSINRQGL